MTKKKEITEKEMQKIVNIMRAEPELIYLAPIALSMCVSKETIDHMHEVVKNSIKKIHNLRSNES